jgi:5-methyltetrahydrofolate--homocysteine methyltransferase
MFVYTIYCEATTHSALLETGIREIKTGHRDVTFDEMVACYREQVEALLEGGVDLLVDSKTAQTLYADSAIA